MSSTAWTAFLRSASCSVAKICKDRIRDASPSFQLQGHLYVWYDTSTAADAAPHWAECHHASNHGSTQGHARILLKAMQPAITHARLLSIGPENRGHAPRHRLCGALSAVVQGLLGRYSHIRRRKCTEVLPQGPALVLPAI